MGGDYSEQQLVDCAYGHEGAEGCGGAGWSLSESRQYIDGISFWGLACLTRCPRNSNNCPHLERTNEMSSSSYRVFFFTQEDNLILLYSI